MPFEDDKVYSTTIDRTKKGRGFVNILAHDPPTETELGQAPAMEPLKHFDTEEKATTFAGERAQKEYDALRNDPSSQWYIPKDKPLQMNKMTDPLDLLKSGLKTLELNAGFDVQEHMNRALTTGPFADAQKRQANWLPQVAQLDTTKMQGNMKDGVYTGFGGS